MEEHEKILALRYLGDDLVTWLSEVCEDEPVLIPYWPDSDRYAVLQLVVGPERHALFRAASSDVLARMCGPNRLWFCRVPTAVAEAMTDVIG